MTGAEWDVTPIVVAVMAVAWCRWIYVMYRDMDAE